MKANKSDRNNLAIIGASGTGKTTLAVGLYATSTAAFTVSPVGDETRKYLEIRKTSIEEGFWPGATLESENFDLRLRLHVSGNQTDIVFREYMGERMERDPNYIREVIGTPKSAMILFNPGMPGLSKPETRNRMLGNLKVIAQHLKDNGCIAVAFVVTASDRFTSDLAAFREDFEAYASEVTNHLTNLGLEWKRFEVTVSGQLDDQNKPKLARGENNTTHEPFLWLLKRISDFNNRKRNRKIGAVGVGILAIFSVIYLCHLFYSCNVLAQAETAFANTTNALNMAYIKYNEADVRMKSEFLKTNGFCKISVTWPWSSLEERKQTLIEHAKEQNDLWSVRLLRMEFASNMNKIATRPLEVQTDWFKDFDKRLIASSPSFKAAVAERYTLTNEWAKSSGMLETKCQTAHFRYEVDQERKNLASAKPDALSAPLQKSKELIADAVTYALVTNRAELCANLGLMTARTNAIARFIDSTMGKTEDDNPPEDTIALRQQISKELKKTLTGEEFEKLADVISQRHSVARTAWERHHFPLLKQKQIAELKAVSAAPADALRNSLVFLNDLDSLFASIPENERVAAKGSITNERVAAIDRYLEVKMPWKPDDKDPPDDTAELQRQVRQELKSALTEEESESLWTKLEKRRDAARTAWDNYHFPKRVAELKTALKSSVANPSEPLKDSLDFLGNLDKQFPSIPEDNRSAAKESIVNERTAAIGRYLNGKTKWKPEDDEPPVDTAELQQQLREELTSALTEAEFETLLGELEKRRAEARKAWDAYHFQPRVRELETALNGGGSNPTIPLKDSMAFLGVMTNNYPTISTVEFINARHAIGAARKNALIAYASSIAGKWNANGSKPPEFDAEGIRTTILTEVAVTDEEYKSFSSDMNARFEKTREAWDAKQKKLVDEFVTDGDIETVVREYGRFCDEWPNNPYLYMLNRKIESQLIGFFRGYIFEYYSEFFGKDRVGNAEYPKSRMEKAQMRFNKFKGVCLAITGRGLYSTPIPKTNVGRFAADCVNYGNLQDAGITAAFGQEFKITEVAVKFSPSSLDSSFGRLVIGCNLLAERWNFSLGCKEKLEDINLFSESLYKSACDGGWHRLWSGNVTIRANPWTFTSFRISYGDKTGYFMVDKNDSQGYWLDFEEGRNSPEYSTNIRLVHGFNTDTAGELSIRITFSGKGTDLTNLWKRSMQ